MKYEDMKKNLPAAVSQVDSFIGADISDDIIDKVLALTDFNSMKRDATAFANNIRFHKLLSKGNGG